MSSTRRSPIARTVAGRRIAHKMMEGSQSGFGTQRPQPSRRSKRSVSGTSTGRKRPLARIAVARAIGKRVSSRRRKAA